MPGLRSSGVAALAVGAVGLAVGCAGGASPTSIALKRAIAVDVGARPIGQMIQPGFVGLSTEYTALSAYAGRDPNSLNPTFIRLVDRLAAGASPVIRIGGDTTDWTWWPQGGEPKPSWARYVLTPLWISIARAVAIAAHAQLILGINFEADSRSLAAAESSAQLRVIGTRQIAAFELGNEPEVYGEIPWYASARGIGLLGRAASYGVRAYLSDFGKISAALPPNVPVAGPALALTWPLRIARRFLAREVRVRMFTFHAYPLKRCYNAPGSPTYPTLAHLLSPRAERPPAGTAAAVSAAHARGVAVRVDEINTVSCRGLHGLSDTFASALWALDALFGFAEAGVDGVNLHTLPHASYQLFTFTHASGKWEASVKPIYYGLQMFTQAAPPGSRLLPTSHPADTMLRTWATRGPRGTVRVVLINASSEQSLAVAVKAPTGGNSATLERLIAPGITAFSGVTLGGQGYGASTATGMLSGARKITIMHGVGGRYLVKLPAASAALLTLVAP